MRRFHSLVLAALLGALGCRPATDAAESTPPSAVAETSPAAESLDPEVLREWVAFLADDEQGGRPPGGDADVRVRSFVADKMKSFGLQPAGDDGFSQSFQITDGVRLREGKQSRFGVKQGPIAHHIVQFGHDTAADGPATGKLVFVGHGIGGEKQDSGDYAGVLRKVKGNIVVALAGGPDDPHIPPSALRPQSKLIAARDRGAAGFVLWDPQTDVPFPNHGQVSDLKIPAVFVGAAGSEALLAALGAAGKKPGELKPGLRSRGKAELDTPTEPIELETANVIGLLPGSRPGGERVIIGAHLDHLGMGTASSLAPGERAVHNGADDNASGVATLLGIAKVAASRPASQRPRDLVFVAFAAEEMGLLGSKHMVENMSAEDRARTVAMINFDMVGRLQESLIVNGTGTAKEWEGVLKAVAGDLELSFVSDGYGPSDHAAFYEAEIPVLHLFTGAHEDYHKPTDDIEKINFAGAARVGEFALAILDELDRQPAKLSYVKTEKKSSSRGGFRVSLGTMPDYAASVDGLKLAGVRGGGAAEKAGLKKGDVIVQIGDREIHGVDDFMASFASLEPAKEVVFVIIRDGERQEVPVTPSAPRPH